MIFRSIKWRLQLWYGVILLAVLGGFGYTAFELQRMREYRRVDSELHERMAMLIGPLRRPGRPPPGREGPRDLPRDLPRELLHDMQRDSPRDLPGDGPLRRPEDGRPEKGFRGPGEESEAAFPEEGPFYFGVWDRGGKLIRSRNLPEETMTHRRTRAGIYQVQGRRELHQITPRGESVVVGRSIRVELQELTNLALLLVVSGLGILAVGLSGGWIVATRAMRPIESISRTALKISTGDLSQRIVQAESESELGRLISVLNATFARLESSFAEQVRFTTDVSHELRTPVSVIVSQTQMALGRERGAAEYRASLEACQRAAQRMRGLIESLMQLARLDAGQEEIRSESFDLGAVAEESGEMLRPLAAERRITLRVEREAARTNGDAGKIGQVVTNLLSNAIRYTPEGGEVKVRSGVENGFAILAVSDTGVGVPAEDLPHIFDRFYRVDASRSRDKGGSGLGLAIARAIVHAHGGRIDVNSEPGQGSQFTVRLPIG